MTEADIVHETSGFWVSRHGRGKRKRYDVNKLGPQCSTTVQSFEFSEDGKYLAVAYCNYMERRKNDTLHP